MSGGGPADSQVLLDRGRAAFKRRAWADAYAQLTAADRQAGLAPDDLESLAIAACLVGHDDHAAAIWERAHHEAADRDDHAAAARCAFRLSVAFLNRGEAARGAGWLARARRQLDQTQRECAEHGYLVLPDAIQQAYSGDYASALAASEVALAVGERCGDAGLVAFARCVRGRALVRQGKVAEGMALLDEVMVAILGDEVSPVLAGDLYCSVIEGCQDAYDLRRAREWTAALSRWCDQQPDLVPYRGNCQLHRAEIMLFHGAWPDARETAESSYEQLIRPPSHPAAGAACYLLAELYRLSGEFLKADGAYREASQRGRDPHPGLALLRLAQGQPGTALAAIRRALNERSDRAGRAPLLAAAVDILLDAGDRPAARAAAAELATIATEVNAPVMHAMAARANGAVLCAEGDASAALAELHRGWKLWHELTAPYETASVRVLRGVACRAVGDEDGAQLEFDAAAAVFAELGAGPDLARVESLAVGAQPAADTGLTAREVQVLQLVAAGKSNRAIATDLFLSEKTVARHVSNILTKLGLPSRSAATAYAFRHGLV
jgi:DNA-binding CsgD family transcriptional regulator/tetratricopeptide (TPR) repeat protein